MSKRNLILFTIILIIIAIMALGFLYFRTPKESQKEEEGVVNFLAQFNPFRKTPSTTPPPTTPPTETPSTPTPEPDMTEIKLRKVSSMPVAGFTVYQKERFKEVPEIPQQEQLEGAEKKAVPTPPPTEFAPALRYVARATGNVYQTFADKIDERKFSSTLIPKVYEAYFGKGAESVIMRYLKLDEKTIETFAGAVPKENLGADSVEDNEIKGTFLPGDITDLSFSPDRQKIFYLFNTGGSAVGVTSGVLGDNKVQVFDSPFSEWLSTWPNNSMITLTTKPAATVLGYMYAIDPSKKDLKKVMGNINGLTTLTSPNGKLVLWSDNNLSLGIYEIATGSNSVLGARTLPEKCVWSKTSEVLYCAVPKFASLSSYPDSWYRGEISFLDEVWKIDLLNNTSTIVSDLAAEQGGGEIDGIKLMLDENEDYLFFVNKKDSYLWELSLK